MKKSHLLAIATSLVILAGSFVSVGTSTAQPSDIHIKEPKVHAAAKYVPDEIIVRFKPGVGSALINKINKIHGVEILSISPSHRFRRLRVPKGKTVEELAAVYRNNPNVVYAEPNFIAHAFGAPNDPYYSYQWHMDNDANGGIQLNAARDIETGLNNVIVAVVDTGVAYEDYQEPGALPSRPGPIFAQAPDLANTLFAPGYDFVNNDSHPNDDEGHGTHVTGTIAQSTDNYLGVAGVAPGCTILPVKVLDSNGSGYYSTIADGIYFAADNGAKVINLSLGGAYPSVTLENALAYAYNAGVTIICASGNDSASSVSYPAAYDNYCIAVGATRYDENVAWYSNQGTSLDLTAPGGDLSVDQNNDGYGDGVLQQTHNGVDFTSFSYYFYQGTSMATPHVVGVASLLISQAQRNGVELTPADVRTALQATAEDHGPAGWDTAYGWGIVDAQAAMQYFSQNTNTAPIADPKGPYTGVEYQSVTFDGVYDSQTGAGSYDPDGDTITYLWDFGDGATGSGPTPVHSYDSGGTFTVTLVVNDGMTNSDPVSTTATITEVNDAPVADAGPDQSVTTGSLVDFDGSGSFDDEGATLSYQWDLGDGSVAYGIAPTHTYSQTGTYNVTLTVDDGTLTGSDTAVVTVTDAPALPPLHVDFITMSFKVAGRNTRALASVKIVDADGSPVSGATVYGQWSGGAANADSDVTNSDGLATLESNFIKYSPPGTVFTITITDVSLTDWTYDENANGETTDSITK